jgi:hypothetical protein
MHHFAKPKTAQDLILLKGVFFYKNQLRTNIPKIILQFTQVTPIFITLYILQHLYIFCVGSLIQ